MRYNLTNQSLNAQTTTALSQAPHSPRLPHQHPHPHRHLLLPIFCRLLHYFYLAARPLFPHPYTLHPPQARARPHDHQRNLGCDS